MKLSSLLATFKIFGLLLHFLLVVSLVLIGFYDFIGFNSLVDSTNSLLETLALSQSASNFSCETANQSLRKTMEMFPFVITVIKKLSILSVLSFVAHLLGYINNRGQ